MKQVILLIIMSINIYACYLYYLDKKRAINKKYRDRISEKYLLSVSFMLGGMVHG